MDHMNKNSSYALLGVLVVASPLFLSVLPSISMAQGAGSPPTEKCPQQKTGSGAEKSSLNVGAGSNINCKPKDTEGFYEGKPYQWQCIEGTKVMSNILGKPCDVKDPKSGVTTKGTCDYAEACKASDPTGQAQPGGAPKGGEQKQGGGEGKGEMPQMPQIPSGGGGDSGGGSGGGQPQQQGGEQQQQQADGTRSTDTTQDPNNLEQTRLGADGKPLTDDANAPSSKESSNNEDWFGTSLNPLASNTQNSGADAADPFGNASSQANSARQQTGIDPEAPFSDAASELLDGYQERSGSVGQRAERAPLPQDLEVRSIESPTYDNDGGVVQDSELQLSNQRDSDGGVVNSAGFRASASFQESFDSGYTPPQSMIQRAYNSVKDSILGLFRF
jgi:hypothetical protein